MEQNLNEHHLKKKKGALMVLAHFRDPFLLHDILPQMCFPDMAHNPFMHDNMRVTINTEPLFKGDKQKTVVSFAG